MHRLPLMEAKSGLGARIRMWLWRRKVSRAEKGPRVEFTHQNQCVKRGSRREALVFLLQEWP